MAFTTREVEGSSPVVGKKKLIFQDLELNRTMEIQMGKIRIKKDGRIKGSGEGGSG